MPRKLIHVPWTTEVDELLCRLWRKPLTVAAIGRRMQRNPTTIQARAAALGLPPRQPGAKLPGQMVSTNDETGVKTSPVGTP